MSNTFLEVVCPHSVGGNKALILTSLSSRRLEHGHWFHGLRECQQTHDFVCEPCIASYPCLVSLPFYTVPTCFHFRFFLLIISSLGLDKAEWLEDIQKGECSLKGFLSVVGEYK